MLCYKTLAQLMWVFILIAGQRRRLQTEPSQVHAQYITALFPSSSRPVTVERAAARFQDNNPNLMFHQQTFVSFTQGQTQPQLQPQGQFWMRQPWLDEETAVAQTRQWFFRVDPTSSFLLLRLNTSSYDTLLFHQRTRGQCISSGHADEFPVSLQGSYSLNVVCVWIADRFMARWTRVSRSDLWALTLSLAQTSGFFL